MAKILLDYGADLSIENASGLTPVIVAKKLGFTSMVDLLREKMCSSVTTNPVENGGENHEGNQHDAIHEKVRFLKVFMYV